MPFDRLRTSRRYEEFSGRRRIFLELLDIALFDFLHEGFALEEIALEFHGKLPRDDEKLVVNDFGKRDGATSGNEVRPPLKDEAGVPERDGGENDDRDKERSAPGAEELRGAVKENGEAENEERSERNEKAVAVGGNAGPVRIARNKNVKGESGGKKGSAGARLAAPENKKTGDGEKEDGRPGDQAVIGGEKNGEKVGRKPVP